MARRMRFAFVESDGRIMKKNSTSAVSNPLTELGKSINSIFMADGEDDEIVYVNLSDIHIEEQIREEFENAEQTLDDLGDDLLKHWIQPICLRPRAEGGYTLVVGERRVQAARLKGIFKAPSIIREMTDQEADEMQASENIHRKNLTQIEEARRVKRDLDRLGGDRAALMKKYNKNKVWVTKTLGILDLGPEAKKLITERLTADKEVINSVKQIEKIDPQEAKKAVDAVRSAQGSTDARALVNQVKATVKPSAAKLRQTENETEDPLKTSMAAPFSLWINELENDPDEANVEPMILMRLKENFEEGKSTLDAAQSLIAGLNDGTYGTHENAALRLAAFMQGVVLLPNLDFKALVRSVKGDE